MECEGQGDPSRWTRPGGGERVGSLEAGAGLTGENGEEVWQMGKCGTGTGVIPGTAVRLMDQERQSLCPRTTV